MAHTTHVDAASPPRRRSHAGRLAAAAIGIASATGLGVGLNQTDSTPSHVARTLPDSSLTPGLTDPNVHDADICKSIWKATVNGEPPAHGGTLTYSKAARHTSETVKNQAFAEYGLKNPKDGGQTYEVDHLIPLSLGGRDDLHNLWPQSRVLQGYNAWSKDRLEFRLYNMLCHHQDGDPPITLAKAQQALRHDWTKAYADYCGESEDDCPAYSGHGD